MKKKIEKKFEFLKNLNFRAKIASKGKLKIAHFARDIYRIMLGYLMLWNWLIKSAFSMTFLWWTLKIATNILSFGLFFTASYHTLESLEKTKREPLKILSHLPRYVTLTKVFQKWYSRHSRHILKGYVTLFKRYDQSVKVFQKWNECHTFKAMSHF